LSDTSANERKRNVYVRVVKVTNTTMEAIATTVTNAFDVYYNRQASQTQVRQKFVMMMLLSPSKMQTESAIIKTNVITLR